MNRALFIIAATLAAIGIAVLIWIVINHTFVFPQLPTK